MQILNMKLVASEICRTLIGSLALIIVAHDNRLDCKYDVDPKGSENGRNSEKEKSASVECRIKALVAVSLLHSEQKGKRRYLLKALSTKGIIHERRYPL